MSRLPGVNLLKKKYFWGSYGPLKVWTLKSRNKDVSKTALVSSFKLGQLMEDDEYLKFFCAMMNAIGLDKQK